MDAKVTLSFNQEAIASAKRFAEKHNISLSRLTEFLYSQLESTTYRSLEELPVADWVHQVAEGKVEYRKSSKAIKKDYYESRKK
ncbi:MAG: DUF6364 family protein [Ekhidna sp.]|uniref:DUF6364 family protein n=1 Tax=Ekhidna sp. TaxID=2608089 RepID=UPI0032ECED2D